MSTSNRKPFISTSVVFICLLLLLTSLSRAAEITGRSETMQAENKDKVIHTKEVYKIIDTFNLKIDIFYTSQSLGKENKTAIVFFHGGGWAYGTPGEFFTTCERYAKMGIVTFSVDYRLVN